MNTPHLRVAHVITDLFTGGAEMMLCKLLPHLVKHNIQSTVISLRDEGTLGERIKAMGVNVHTLGMNPTAPNPLALVKLNRLQKRLKPDVVQGWMYHGNLAAQWACANVPVVWNIRQSLYNLANEKRATAVLIRLGAKTSKRTHTIVYNARTSARQHEGLGYTKQKSLVLANGFEPEVFKPDKAARSTIRNELQVNEGTKLIGLVARHHPMKDHDNFIKAALGLLAQRNDVAFVLAGKGVDSNNSDLLKPIKPTPWLSKFHLLGERHDIPALTTALDLATSASAYNEGFPNVVGEAMACGVPCVVTDVGDSKAVVGDTGRVVPPRNAPALTEAWASLLSLSPNAFYALKTAARQRVLNNYSIGTISQQYADLYHAIAIEKTIQ